MFRYSEVGVTVVTRSSVLPLQVSASRCARRTFKPVAGGVRPTEAGRSEHTLQEPDGREHQEIDAAHEKRCGHFGEQLTEAHPSPIEPAKLGRDQQTGQQQDSTDASHDAWSGGVSAEE